MAVAAHTRMLVATLVCAWSEAAKITLNIHFSESAFDLVWNDPEAGKTPYVDCSPPGSASNNGGRDSFKGPCYPSDRYFMVSWYTCMTVLGTPACPGGQATFDGQWAVYAGDKVSTQPGLWRKEIDTGDTYVGPVVLSLAIPIALDLTNLGKGLSPFVSPVKECVVKSSTYCEANRTIECINAYPRLQGELCNQLGTPYRVDVVNVGASYVVDAYPAFGFMTGTVSNLLLSVPSPTLVLPGSPPNTTLTRDVPVYVPPSLSQNRAARKLNMMVTFDTDLEVASSLAFRAGFEAAQIRGDAPESLLIGIGVLQFAFAGNLAQRTYELTWSQTLDTRFSCNGNSEGDAQPVSGGSALLLTFIDEVVIPGVLTKLSSQLGSVFTRGEISIAGGSLGGLTACYAAAARPATFARAMCFAPTNCHNFISGGLAPVITSCFLASGVKARTVLQYFTSEIYARPASNQTKPARPTPELNPSSAVYPQLEYMRNEQEAWRAIGLTVFDFGASTAAPSPAALTGGSYRPYDASYATRTTPRSEDSIVASYLWPGGQHCAESWEKQFAFSMNMLYRAQPKAYDVSPTAHDGVRMPASEHFKHMFISPSATSSAADVVIAQPTCAASDVSAFTTHPHDALIATIAVLAVLLMVVVMGLVVSIWLLLRNQVTLHATPRTGLLKTTQEVTMSANAEGL